MMQYYLIGICIILKIVMVKQLREKTYNRYCMDCHKPFYLVSNLIIGDIINT